MTLTRDTLRQILDAALSTHESAIGCDECFAQLGQYAEGMLLGREISEALSLTQAHLQDCPDCEEEFQALLALLRGLQVAQ